MTDTQTKKGLTLEGFKLQYPDVHKQVFDAGKAEGEAEGRKKGLEYFKRLAGVLDGDNDLLVECYSNGKSELEAIQMVESKHDKNARLDGDEMTDQQLRSRFADSSLLQEEFAGNVENYIAFRRKSAAGRVKIMRATVIK